jgi:transposase
MILNALGFTSKPLYMSPEFFKRRDLKFLLGASVTQPELVLTAAHLNEHKLGRTLDKIAEVGPDRVFLRVAARAFRTLKVSVPQVHLDTTTHSFSGLYEDEDGNPKGADFHAAGSHT